MPEEFRDFCVKRIRIVCGSSWQTRQTFEQMMTQYYLPEMVHRRELLGLHNTPILLLLDGQLSLPVIAIWNWKLQLNKKKLSEKKTSREEEQALLEENAVIEAELKEWQGFQESS